MNWALIVCAIVAFLLGSGFVWYKVWLHDPTIADENHLLEWLQIVVEGVAAVMFFMAWGRSSDLADRFQCFGLGLLCVSFVLRELPIRHMIDGSRGTIVHHSTRGGMAVAWIVYLILARGHLHMLWPAFLKFCGSTAGRLTLLCGAMFIIAWPFDHWRFKAMGIPSGFVEELLEFQGAVLLMWPAWLLLRNSGRPASTPSAAVADESS